MMIGPYELDSVTCADALDFLRALPDGYVNCIVTSPPYFGLRDYGVTGQLGLEPTLREYLDRLTAVFAEARRVLRDDGVAWVNMGDSYVSSPAGSPSEEYIVTQVKGDGAYARRYKNNHRGTFDKENDARTTTGWNNTGFPPKSLLGMPWRLAFALQDAGWILRSDCIWHKPNPMPEGVTDRPTKAHEYVFLLSKTGRYWYDADAVRERLQGNGRGGDFSKRYADAQLEHGGESHRADYANRNLRTVWTLATESTPFAHFATFPRALARRCILSGCPIDGVVLDPFMGSGTVALVARELGRHYIGCDLSAEYVELARGRLSAPYTPPLFVDDAPAPRAAQLPLDLTGDD